MGKEVGVSVMLESFAEEISQMAKTDEDHVADVGRKQNVIRWVLFIVVWNGLAGRVLGYVAVFVVRAMAKFRMKGIEDLFGGRGCVWIGKSVIVVVHLGLAFT